MLLSGLTTSGMVHLVMRRSQFNIWFGTYFAECNRAKLHRVLWMTFNRQARRQKNHRFPLQVERQCLGSLAVLPNNKPLVYFGAAGYVFYRKSFAERSA